MDEDILKEGHVVDKGDNHDFNLGHVEFELHLFKPSKNNKYTNFDMQIMEMRIVVRCKDF